MSTVTDPIADFLARIRNGTRAQTGGAHAVLENQGRDRAHLERRRLYYRLLDRHERCASAHQDHQQNCGPIERRCRVAPGEPPGITPLRWRGRNSASSRWNGSGDSFHFARCFIRARSEKAKSGRRSACLRLVNLCHESEIKRSRFPTKSESTSTMTERFRWKGPKESSIGNFRATSGQA